MHPHWIEPPPIPESVLMQLAALGEITPRQAMRRIGRGQARIPIYVDPWKAAYQHARRIAAAREEWPWPER